MTCKDCFHYHLCRKRQAEAEFKENPGLPCAMFVDRSRTVEFPCNVIVTDINWTVGNGKDPFGKSVIIDRKDIDILRNKDEGLNTNVSYENCGICKDIVFPSRAQFITKLSEDTESISTVGYKFAYKDEQYGDYIILDGESPEMVTEAKEQLVDRMCAVFAKLIKKDL